MTSESIPRGASEALALDLDRALATQDLAALYHDDALSWHNFTNVALTKKDALELVGGFFAGFEKKGYSPPRYVEVRRDYTDKGFLQQHVVEARRGEQVFRMAACLIIELRDGKIFRQYEYLDPKPYLQLMEED